MPKISIITTTYKHEKFIAQTIESILKQSFTDWELLIGDDSPDDATWSIIQSYVKKYPDKIRAWHHSPNKGIVGNMNFLLGEISSSVEYISFLEGDDMYTSNKLIACINIFDKNSDVSVVYTNFASIDADSQLIGGIRNGYTKLPFPNLNAKITHQQFFNNFCYGAYPNIFSYSTGMIRKDILSKVGNSIPNTLGKKYTTISDFDFYFRVLEQTRCYGINEKLVLYRTHQSNLSKEDGRIIQDLEQLIQKYYSDGIISKREYRLVKSKIALIYSSNAIVAGRKKESLLYITKSLQYFPHSLFMLAIRNLIATFTPLNIIRKVIKI